MTAPSTPRPAATIAHGALLRDRLTWLTYVLLGVYSFGQALLGPAVAVFGPALNMGYSVRALHLSAFALGMMLSGLGSDVLAARVGRRSALWIGVWGLALGAGLVAVGAHPAFTLAGALLMGLLGTVVMAMVQATLAAHHPQARVAALAEANVIASVGAALAPALVGVGVAGALGWRLGPLALAAACGVAALTMGRVAFPLEKRDWATRRAEHPAQPSRRLPLAFWAFAASGFGIVSVEWCVAFWSADFLAQAVGLTEAQATGAIGGYFTAMVLGRFAGSRAVRVMPPHRVVMASAALALAGFALFWGARALPMVSLAGLFITGLGTANLFPLTVNAAIGASPGQTDTASARITAVAGSAMLLTPLALGAWAGQVGITLALAWVMPLLVAVLLLRGWAQRLATARAIPQ